MESKKRKRKIREPLVKVVNGEIVSIQNIKKENGKLIPEYKRFKSTKIDF